MAQNLHQNQRKNARKFNNFKYNNFLYREVEKNQMALTNIPNSCACQLVIDADVGLENCDKAELKVNCKTNYSNTHNRSIAAAEGEGGKGRVKRGFGECGHGLAHVFLGPSIFVSVVRSRNHPF